MMSVLTAKSYMVAILSAIGIATMLAQGFYLQFFLLPAIAALMDVAINYAKSRNLIMPSSAIISGMLLSMILPPLSVAMQFLAAIAAIASKHVIRWKGRNIFNPAAFSVNMMSFATATAWWGATLPVVAIGFFIPYYMRRLRMVTAFLATYFAINTVLSGVFSVDYAAVFFAVFMLLEPKTSPHTRKGMILFGAFAAILSFLLGYVQMIDKFVLALVAMNLSTNYLNRKFS